MTGPHDLPGTEDRLRTALSEHAQTIEPSGDGLQRIEERLMDPQNDIGDPGANGQSAGRRNPLLIGAAAAAAVVIGIVTFVAISDSDDSDVVADTTTTSSTSTSTTTTTSPPTTTEPPFAPVVDPFAVAYPGPLTSQRFDAPEPAGRGYATDVLGFTDLVAGDFQQGDSRSGELTVSDRDGGPETTIILRQMEDDTWFVLGSQTSDIVVETPEAGDLLASPSFDTTGMALAFEGTVDVFVRLQSDPAPIGEGFVTGSGVPPAGPFTGTIDFDAPGAELPGIVVYRTLSAEDGHVVQATSFPVSLTAE